MKKELYNRLLKLIGEHKINLMSPRGLLEISVATIEVVKAHKIESGQYPNLELNCFDRVAGCLRSSR